MERLIFLWKCNLPICASYLPRDRFTGFAKAPAHHEHGRVAKDEQKYIKIRPLSPKRAKDAQLCRSFWTKWRNFTKSASKTCSFALDSGISRLFRKKTCSFALDSGTDAAFHEKTCSCKACSFALDSGETWPFAKRPAVSL